MAKAYTGNDYQAFWKKVKKTNNSKAALSEAIGDAKGEKDVNNLWANRFKGIFKSVKNISSKDYVQEQLREVLQEKFSFTSVFRIAQLVKTLPNGKSAGHDGLTADYAKSASLPLNVLLSVCFNATMVHGHVPLNMTKVILVPIVKNKTGDITMTNNYSQTYCVSCRASVLLDYCKDYINFSDYQFTFKASHSTDTCIFVFKQVDDYYTRNASSIFTCYLDASNAFNKVYDWTLYRKLMDRNVPLYIVGLLVDWYNKHQFYICWGNSISRGFGFNNGVRQGSVLSPLLYNVYIDDLNKTLCSKRTGCEI